MWIYPEQLFIKLTTELKFIYILFGNDCCILKDCQLNIINKAKTLGFNEHINIELDLYYDWNKIFNLCRIPDLLKKQKILSLKFPQDYPIAYFNKYISLLIPFLYKEVLFILYIYASNYIKKDNICFQSFLKIGTFVICITPKNVHLTMWVINQAKHMQLSIEKSACQLLCYYYEDNLILLKQMLQLLSLIYPDGNLNFTRVKKIVTDSAHFNVNHWIEAILVKNKQRANRVLQQLEYTDTNLTILLQKIQHEIFVLINIKYSLTPKISLHTILKKYKIHDKYYFTLLLQSIEKFSVNQLYQSLALLVQMELKYKKDRHCLSKSSFELLTAMLCADPN